MGFVERAQQTGNDRIDLCLMIHQGIHAAQQVPMTDRGGINIGHGDGFQPAQDAEFGFGIAQHDFYKKSPANPHGCVADPSKNAVFEVELSNRGTRLCRPVTIT